MKAKKDSVVVYEGLEWSVSVIGASSGKLHLELMADLMEGNLPVLSVSVNLNQVEVIQQ